MSKEIIQNIEQTILEFEQTGRASKTALARCIIGRLSIDGFEIVKKEESETITCPLCKGEEYSKTKSGFKCAYTDCLHEWDNTK
jgi:tRNA(Ile2) C34 agmatinyltransferase TiaS